MKNLKLITFLILIRLLLCDVEFDTSDGNDNKNIPESHPNIIDESSSHTVCTINENGKQVCKSSFVEAWTREDYSCEDRQASEQCEYWKLNGECNNNKGYMILNCPKTCGKCHLLNTKTRCQRNPKYLPAIKNGDINKIFERAIKEFPQYSPQVLSYDPYVVIFDNLFNEIEAKRLIHLGGKNFRRSVDAGNLKDDAQFEEIISEARTSYTDWCVYGCWEDPLIQNIVTRIENLTTIPKENSEYLQVLRYEKKQYYVRHHDYIHGHLDLPIGPRLFTFFLYLSNVTKGGHTKFNSLGFSVEPKLGRGALWPSVLNNNIYEKDDRTEHEALPVIEGVKYAANMWLHLYNFHEPFTYMCTG